MSASTIFTPNYDHIVVVVEENHASQEIIGNSQAGYINLLASRGALFTNYHAITHPSQPNYFALYAGSTFGVQDNNIHQEGGPTLATILQGAGKTFTGFVESGSPKKHNPWESFPEGFSIESNVDNFSNVFVRLPRVSFIIPNLQNDMHDGTIAQADQWLFTHVDAYAQWAKENNSLLIITWDEDDNGPTNQVPLILYGAHVNQGTFGGSYNHYDLLATILEASGLDAPNLAKDAIGIGNGVFVNGILDDFSPLEYLASNPDLIQTGFTPAGAEQHYIAYGFYEHRSTTSFDAAEYLASNPDLIQVGFNPETAKLHFVMHGFYEHRPTTSFDAAEYLASNPDLIQTGFNPESAKLHYVLHGFNEHRPTTSFDAAEYLASNPDLLQTGSTPESAKLHYIQHGFYEHRPTGSFDVLEYLASNPDLIQVGFNPVSAKLHYVMNGFYEHRATTSFDVLEYLASNPDLIQTGFTPESAKLHFVMHGFYEHRSTTSFDAAEYLASNPDLIQTGFTPESAKVHYVMHGFYEHRPTTSFDAAEYLASNPDLIQVGFTPASAEQHYVANGFFEHRPTNSFDAAQYLANYSDLIAVFGAGNFAAARQHFISNGFSEHRTDQRPVIVGDGGNNTLVAKNGAIMTGGAGADTFVFNSSLLTPATVTDFAVGTDHLQISASGFGHGLTAGGTAPLVSAPTPGSATHAGTSGYFIFDNANTVWWDPTGGSGADAIALTKLSSIAALHTSDFLLA